MCGVECPFGGCSITRIPVLVDVGRDSYSDFDSPVIRVFESGRLLFSVHSSSFSSLFRVLVSLRSLLSFFLFCFFLVRLFALWLARGASHMAALRLAFFSDILPPPRLAVRLLITWFTPDARRASEHPVLPRIPYRDMCIVVPLLSE